jgi:hypothetical protein
MASSSRAAARNAMTRKRVPRVPYRPAGCSTVADVERFEEPIASGLQVAGIG